MKLLGKEISQFSELESVINVMTLIITWALLQHPTRSRCNFPGISIILYVRHMKRSRDIRAMIHGRLLACWVGVGSKWRAI